MSNPEENPKIIDEKEIRKQKIIMRKDELQNIINTHQSNIKELQANMAEISAKLQQKVADLNFAMGSLNEKKLELQEYDKK